MGKYEVNEQENAEGKCSFLYNKATGAFLGRTGKSWLLIIIFYIIYYAFLCGFWILMMYVFLSTLIFENKPRLSGEQSLLRGVPGVGFAPRFSNISTLIHVSQNPATKYYGSYDNVTTALFDRYNVDLLPKEETKMLDNCNITINKKDDSGNIDKPCIFKLANLGPCANPADNLRNGSLCVFLTVNKLFGWLPETKNNSNFIGVSCKGQNTGDVENLGEPEYYPSFNMEGKTYGAFSNLFFPYVKQKNYQTPLVAMQLKNIKHNVVILVECVLSNFNTYGRGDQKGKFEIFLSSD